MKKSLHFSQLFGLLALLGTLQEFRAEPAKANPLSDQILQRRVFKEPLLWVGDQPPDEAESLALSAALEVAGTNHTARRVEQLEQFVTAHPGSPWAPSIRANLAVVYRF